MYSRKLLTTLAIVLAGATAMTALVLAADPPSGPARQPATQPAASQPTSAPAKLVTLTVFNTGDIHEHTRNLAKIAAYVKAARKKDPNVLFLDAGDWAGGNGAKQLSRTRGEGMVRLMIAAGYDGIVFGNHCHGLGAKRLIELKRKYPKFPLLVANVKWTDADLRSGLSQLMPPYKIVQLQGLKVGIIGGCSHDTRYARKNRFAVTYIPSAVQHYVPIVRKHADIVIAITHQFEGNDYALASSANAPDLIVGGHSHGGSAQVYGKDRQSYLLKAGRYTRYVGKVVLTWDGTKIIKREGKYIKVDKDWKDEDPEVNAVVDDYFESRDQQSL